MLFGMPCPICANAAEPGWFAKIVADNRERLVH